MASKLPWGSGIAATVAASGGGSSDFTSGPSGSDVLVYDDNFDTITGLFTDSGTYTSVAARATRITALQGGSTEFFMWTASDNAQGTTATLATSGGGLNGSPRYLRLDANNISTNQPDYNSSIVDGFHASPRTSTHPYAAPGSTLVMEFWARVDTSSAPNFLWFKWLEAYHSSSGPYTPGTGNDRTQYGVYITNATLGWANIHPWSNNKEIYHHMEDGATDAPVTYKRWSSITGQGFKRHTMVYKYSTGTTTQRDGINQWYVEGEKIIDASQTGKDSGWMANRQINVVASSTSPYPGNVGPKDSSVTGDDALLNLSDDSVNAMSLPGIAEFFTTNDGQTARVDIGRIRIWYRP